MDVVRTLVAIGTVCIGSGISNYHTITTTTDPLLFGNEHNVNIKKGLKVRFYLHNFYEKKVLNSDCQQFYQHPETSNYISPKIFVHEKDHDTRHMLMEIHVLSWDRHKQCVNLLHVL